MHITHIESIRVGEYPNIIWVQVYTDTGIVGLGETWYAATTVEAAIHDHFAPLLVDFKGLSQGSVPTILPLQSLLP